MPRYKDLLIVDDSMPIRKILARVLSYINLPVGEMHEAGDGEQALELLEKYPIGIILADINMPNMDGLELLRIVRTSEKWHDIPVVLITSEGAEAKVQEAIALGANSYIVKPFCAAVLRRLVTLIPEPEPPKIIRSAQGARP
jgi:two-component system, chemotaxis family, chemotaxis protein CheY